MHARGSFHLHIQCAGTLWWLHDGAAIGHARKREELCVVADLPGVQQSEVDLRLDGNTLAITAEHSSGNSEPQPSQGQDKGNYHVMERSHGLVRRLVKLPFEPDPEQVRAEFKDGVLTVRMPKRPDGQSGRRIPIGQQSSSELSSDGQAGGTTSNGSGASARQ